MPEYVVTFTSMVIDADDEEDAINRAGDFKGGGNWEAVEIPDPVEFVGVTIQFSGSIPTPDGITLNAMMDDGEDQCSFAVTSFAMTETQAKDQLDQFIGALIKAITPQ